MPRKQLIRTNKFPYHVTIRSNNKEWFDLHLKDMWRICLLSIVRASEKHPVKVQAFVLMSNHYHLLIWTPNGDIDKFMFEFNSYLSREIRQKTGRINRIFGDRYKWTLVNDQKHYYNVLKYIYQNPLRAGICSRCEEYQFSTLKYLKNNLAPIYLFDPTLGFEKELFFKEINEQITNEQKEAIHYALNKPVFKIFKKTSSRRAV